MVTGIIECDEFLRKGDAEMSKERYGCGMMLRCHSGAVGAVAVADEPGSPAAPVRVAWPGDLSATLAGRGPHVQLTPPSPPPPSKLKPFVFSLHHR